MDSLSKKLMKELEAMQQQTGRMLRSMSLSRSMSFESGQWQPALDVYESSNEIIIYCELAGTDKDSFSVVVDETQVRIAGVRQLPKHEAIACIHQLEIELGPFSRAVSLPCQIDVDNVSSVYTNGILKITLPKKQSKGKVNISISSGDE